MNPIEAGVRQTQTADLQTGSRLAGKRGKNCYELM